jgi:anti-sigma factor RsiW
MTVTKRKLLEQEPGDMELLLPWHATGTLGGCDSRRVEEALAGDPDLARQFAVIREEYAETIHLNESLGAPSGRAMQKLFAAIEAEPSPLRASPSITARFTGFFAKLSPRTLAWSGSIAALVLLLQAGVIAVVLTGERPASFETASLSTNEPITRDLTAPLPRAMVRFVADARVSDISALLDKYQGSIIEGGQGGLFKLQFGNKAMTKDEVGGLLSRLQNEKIVSLAVATP